MTCKVGAHVVADRVQQVGLAETGVSMDEQRVVVVTWVLGDRKSSRVREAVGGSDDEGVEGVTRVDSRNGLDAALCCSHARATPGLPARSASDHRSASAPRVPSIGSPLEVAVPVSGPAEVTSVSGSAMPRSPA